MRVTPLTAAVLLAAAPTITQAQDWAGEAAFGMLTTSGNEDSRSINGKGVLQYQQEDWLNTFNATAVNSASGNETTAEYYTLGDKLDYSLARRHFVFGALEWEKDLIGGIRERTSETVGYGYRALLGPVHTLNLEVGAGARQTEEQGTGVEENEAIARAGLAYKWAISDTSSFTQTIDVESGASNTFTESISELKLSIIGPIHVGISYTVRNNTDVPADSEKTDTYTAISLSYAFGELQERSL